MGTVVDGPIYVFTLVGMVHFVVVYRELLPETNSDQNLPGCEMAYGWTSVCPRIFMGIALSVFEKFDDDRGMFVCLFFVCVTFPPMYFFLIFFNGSLPR